jgi:hypothetical protein
VQRSALSILILISVFIADEQTTRILLVIFR